MRTTRSSLRTNKTTAALLSAAVAVLVGAVGLEPMTSTMSR